MVVICVSFVNCSSHFSLLFSLILRPCLLYRFWHFCVGNIFYYIICLLISVIFLLYRNILKRHCKFCYYFSLIASRFLHHVWEGLFYPVIIKHFLYFLYFYSFTFFWVIIFSFPFNSLLLMVLRGCQPFCA